MTRVDACMRGDAAAYDAKTDEEEGGAERLLFVPEDFIWDPSSFDGMSWNESSEAGCLPQLHPTATIHDTRAHFSLDVSLLVPHETQHSPLQRLAVVRSDWRLGTMVPRGGSALCPRRGPLLAVHSERF